MATSDDQSILSPAFMARLERLQMVSRRTVAGLRRGERRSSRKGAGSEFADYRNYAPGDDLRFLDWKLYGRLERLFIRLFQAEEDLHITILLDGSRSMGFGSPSKMDCARQLAAALGFLSLSQYDSIILRSFTDSTAALFGPRRGRVHAPALLRTLAAVSAEGKTDMANACDQAARTAPPGSIVILISDFLDFSGFQTAIRKLAARNLQIICVLIWSPEERRPVVEGDLELRDSEYDYRAEISVAPMLLQQYQHTARTYRQELRDFVAARGGALIEVESTADAENIILPLFRKTGLVR